MKHRPIVEDLAAISADPALPAFLARPEGAPAYHGFPVLLESETDGWKYGSITAFDTPEAQGEGDGFVVAPDGQRAGVVWATDTEAIYEILPSDSNRWGVYGVRFPKPVRTKQDLIDCFRHVLPLLKEKYGKLNKA